VDRLLDDAPERLAVDEQADDQLVQTRRRCTAAGPAHQPLAPWPAMAGFALDGLRGRLAPGGLRGGPLAPGGAPASGAETAAPPWVEQRGPRQNDRLLPPPNDRGAAGPTVGLAGVPS
jgi:hypothetical protein